MQRGGRAQTAATAVTRDAESAAAARRLPSRSWPARRRRLAPSNPHECRCAAQAGCPTPAGATAPASRLSRWVKGVLAGGGCRVFSFGSLPRPLHPQQLVQDQAGRAPTVIAAVGHVEGRQRPPANSGLTASRQWKSQKVHHVPMHQAVDHVPNGPAQNAGHARTATAFGRWPSQHPDHPPAARPPPAQTAGRKTSAASPRRQARNAEGGACGCAPCTTLKRLVTVPAVTQRVAAARPAPWRQLVGQHDDGRPAPASAAYRAPLLARRRGPAWFARYRGCAPSGTRRRVSPAP